ncbi:unnamed protein product [Calicophoron daubneyi]|uniref:Uncharacterized protein n=1 Tax=Calicophoron daubneyi TaxID=300641 RepID=A0AAV2U0V7_CALDB
MSQQKSKHQVSIDYCRACGYEVIIRPLIQRIEEELPEVQVTTRISVRDSLEIKYNGFPIFSKLELGGFPDPEKVIETLKGCVSGIPPTRMTTSVHPFYCALL